MSVVRFVQIKDGEKLRIREHILHFLLVEQISGEELTKAILQELRKYNIPLENMRGQACDNAFNMKGKRSEVQNKILCIYPGAFFIPCNSRSLNLVVNDAAMASRDAVLLFGVVQKICFFLSASPRLWSVLKKHVTHLTVKPLNDTRWKSRIDSIRPFRYQAGEIYDALYDICQEMSYDPITRHEAELLASHMRSFKFLCSTVIWLYTLNKVNIASKVLQKKEVDLSAAVKILTNTLEYLKRYRSDDGFSSTLVDAKEIASDLDIEPTFCKENSIRSRRKKKHLTTRF
jgi:hypothetical protein